MSLEQELGREKPLQDLGALVTRYIKLKMSEEGECEEKEEDEEEAPDGFDLCVGTKSSRNKRKRASNCVTHSPSDKSSESLSHVRLTGTIAQYLLSRVPLPTSRLDLQKRFVKPKGSKSSKVDLDSILNHINNKFKSCLGLGIFGLDKSANTAGTASHKSSSNPKYYVVQLNRSKAHLDLVYQFGSINFKSIGDLTTNKDPSLLVSYRLCNSFLTFLSFLFGFFEVTFSDESLVKEDENSLKVLRNHEEIEIPVGKSHTLLSAVLNVSTPITPPTVSDYLLELIHEFTGIVSNSDKMLKELNALLVSKTSASTSKYHDDNDTSTQKSHLPSQIPVLVYILHKTGYLIPTFSQENNAISGFKNGPLLKWDSKYIKKIIQRNSFKMYPT